MVCSQQQWTVEAVLAEFDDHLRSVRGLCAGTRGLYAGYMRAFLRSVARQGSIVPADIAAVDVTDFVRSAARYYRGSRTTEHVATSLRSLFRFFRAAGVREDRLENAVPVVQHRPADLPEHLDTGQLGQLFDSMGSWSSPRGMSDRAIVLCIARLGLRSSEVVRLDLEDLDWREAIVRVNKRKPGRGAVLPLPADVGEAIVDYIQHGRASTVSRRVFVLDRVRPGSPISESIVGRAVDTALDRAGLNPSRQGANLLRHSLATGLLQNGATLGKIGDVLGHRSQTTTAIYARVDVTALSQVALPWPGVKS